MRGLFCWIGTGVCAEHLELRGICVLRKHFWSTHITQIILRYKPSSDKCCTLSICSHVTLFKRRYQENTGNKGSKHFIDLQTAARGQWENGYRHWDTLRSTTEFDCSHCRGQVVWLVDSKGQRDTLRNKAEKKKYLKQWETVVSCFISQNN